MIVNSGWAWMLAIGWFTITFILFIIPGAEFPTEDWFDKIHLDKLIHIGIFGGLVLLFSLAAKLSFPVFYKRSGFILIPLLFIAYGLGIEFLQKHYIANRGFEWMDWVADIGGVTLALLLKRPVLKRFSPPS